MRKLKSDLTVELSTVNSSKPLARAIENLLSPGAVTIGFIVPPEYSGRYFTILVKGALSESKPYSLEATYLNHVPPERCGVDGDEDWNGLADCQDFVCSSFPGCYEVCDQPGDEDGNGLADCDDPVCIDFEGCCFSLLNDFSIEYYCDLPICEDSFVCSMEDCSVIGDEDGNGFADCEDSACYEVASCQ